MMSSFLNIAPEALASASSDLGGIGEAIREATAAAAPSTTGIAPAALDEVSAAIARLFGGYGQQFQSLSAQSGLFHGQFVQLLSSGGSAYAGAEAANASPLSGLLGGSPLSGLLGQAQGTAFTGPVQLLTGRPLFGNGANGAAGPAGPMG
jgi:PE family